LDIFWALKGVTRTPRRAKNLHKAVTRKLLPAEELVPWTINTLAAMIFLYEVQYVPEVAPRRALSTY
jgi:hypothetical protein